MDIFFFQVLNISGDVDERVWKVLDITLWCHMRPDEMFR